MWTTYRQCQIHLIDLQCRIGPHIYRDATTYFKGREYANLVRASHALVEETCASIPFMLMGPSLLETKSTGSVWLHSKPPMLLGGLGLQWMLFTISVLAIVPIETKLQMKRILLWIGKNLGIGQAKVLGCVSVQPRHIVLRLTLCSSMRMFQEALLRRAMR